MNASITSNQLLDDVQSRASVIAAVALGLQICKYRVLYALAACNYFPTIPYRIITFDDKFEQFNISFTHVH